MQFQIVVYEEIYRQFVTDTLIMNASGIEG
jgi:hypothetical protein